MAPTVYVITDVPPRRRPVSSRWHRVLAVAAVLVTAADAWVTSLFGVRPLIAVAEYNDFDRKVRL